MDEQQIKHMVDRFLCWKLPENFNPDCGISFKKLSNVGNEPVGTNLLDATQAEEMVRYMVEGMQTGGGTTVEALRAKVLEEAAQLAEKPYLSSFVKSYKESWSVEDGEKVAAAIRALAAQEKPPADSAKGSPAPSKEMK